MYAHPPAKHILQPPHSAGQPFKGLRTQIDPSQIPSPLEAIESDRDEWEDKPYATLPGSHVPMSTTEFQTIDQGNSSPKFIRMSTWTIPSSSRLASDCQIPIAAVVQPFAELDGDEDIPLVETGLAGPVRCERCRAYINAWCTWTAGGNRWKCNLCSHETQVSPEYFCNLGPDNLRLDHLQRPELHKGTVEFTVPESYWAPHPPPKLSRPYFSPNPPPTGMRKPEPMKYVFLLDISAEALQSGFLRAACDALVRLLCPEDGSDSGFAADCSIAVVTFDAKIHFYDLNSKSPNAPMYVVSDLEEVFSPIYHGAFATLSESRTVINTLLKRLPETVIEHAVALAALGSAIRAAAAALESRGGHIIAFQSTLPTIGAGFLSADIPSTEDGENDWKQFNSRDITWNNIGEECAEEGVGVTYFLGMSKPIDIGSIGVVPGLTGGDIFFHPRFNPVRDAAVLESQLRRVFHRKAGYNCSLKVRCSSSLSVSSLDGNFTQRSSSEVEAATLDADKAFTVSFEHAATLSAREFAHIQVAVLHTTLAGQRRVRVMNLALQVGDLAGNVFRYADIDATVAHSVRRVMKQMKSRKGSLVREELTESCSSILLGYRQQCAAATRPTQLILPEAFKALPVYTLGILKSKPLKGRNVAPDVRNYMMHRFMSMGAREVVQSLYPRVVPIHDLDETIALPDPTSGRILFPSVMRNSYLHMTADGIYLGDNEESAIIWVGSSASPQLLQDLFGVDDVHSLSNEMTSLPVIDSRLSTQVRNILAHQNARRGHDIKMYIARQNLDGVEIEFSDMLVEDQNNANMSYADYLTIVHKSISHALTNGGGSFGSTTNLRGFSW